MVNRKSSSVPIRSILIAIFATLNFAGEALARSQHTNQVLLNSATYREQTAGYYHFDESDYERKGAPIAAQEAVLEALRAKKVYTHPVNDWIKRQLSPDYRSCGEALGDIISWCLVLYGDWYGNKASNTLGNYLYTLLVEKVPRWVMICSEEQVENQERVRHDTEAKL